MSKMGEELEKRLDDNKYAMYEALRRFLESSACTNGCDPEDMTCDMSFARKVIAKVEGKNVA